MRRLLLPLGVAIMLVATPVFAQTTTRVLTGIVLKVTNESLTVLTADRQAVAFVVAGDTKVIGKGLATLIPSPGRRGLRLADALRQGDLVRIVYREVTNRKVAIQVQTLDAKR
jgi:hypothetical protein